jgi:hypothetical protein
MRRTLRRSVTPAHLSGGHEALHRLADNVAHTPGDRLRPPAPCLMKAEEQEADVGTSQDLCPPGFLTVDIRAPGMLGHH